MPYEKIFKKTLAKNYQLCYYHMALERAQKYPGVAQLVACLNGVQEAGSSNLLTRTRTESLGSPFFYFNFGFGIYGY